LVSYCSESLKKNIFYYNILFFVEVTKKIYFVITTQLYNTTYKTYLNNKIVLSI